MNEAVVNNMSIINGLNERSSKRSDQNRKNSPRY